jgi:putative drug exporter of the RND superfamily
MHDVIDPPREGVLARWARLAVRRRWLVLTTWAAILVVLTVLWRLFGGGFATGFTIPGTESQQAFDLLEARFPQQAGDSATLVFKAADGRSISEDRPRIESILDEAGALPSVIGVGSPFVPGGGAVSRDGRIAYATVQYGERANAIPKRDIDALLNLTERAAGDGLVIEAGGQVVQSNEIEPPGTSEVIGLVAAVFILLIAFGSVVAMGLPLATALVGLGASFALIGLGARVLDLPIFSSSFAAMIGIGVGIDYALFVVTRFREALHRGGSVEDAVAAAVSTAGRSVAFAGVVVVIALLGLIAIGIPFVGALGIAGAIVVTLAVLVALTLLPALLGFAGRSVDRWRIPIFHATDTGHQGSISDDPATAPRLLRGRACHSPGALHPRVAHAARLLGRR